MTAFILRQYCDKNHLAHRLQYLSDIAHLLRVLAETSALDKGVLHMVITCCRTPFFITAVTSNSTQFHLWLNKLTFPPFNPRFSLTGFWHSMLRIPDS
jgi:hypothetical protein